MLFQLAPHGKVCKVQKYEHRPTILGYGVNCLAVSRDAAEAASTNELLMHAKHENSKVLSRVLARSTVVAHMLEGSRQKSGKLLMIYSRSASSRQGCHSEPRLENAKSFMLFQLAPCVSRKARPPRSYHGCSCVLLLWPTCLKGAGKKPGSSWRFTVGVLAVGRVVIQNRRW